MDKRDIILTVNIVEPGLAEAVKKHSRELGRPLRGIVIVDAAVVEDPHRIRDVSGIFEEVVCNIHDHAALQKALKPYEGRILAATCRSEAAMELFRLVLPFIPYVSTPTESSLLWAIEKPMMRDRLHAYDPALVPKYCHITESNRGRVAKLTADYTFPVIVKPSGLAESLLVSRCDTMPELLACLERTFLILESIYQRERRKRTPGVLVEEMMQGEMYSVDAYVMRTGEAYCLPPVKVVTAHAAGLNGFYGLSRTLPTDLTDDAVKGAYTAVESSIKALGLRSTTVHVELFYNDGVWKVIELGARMGGYREQLYREAYGVDHYYNDLAVRMDKPPLIPTKAHAAAACLNIYAEEEGEIVSIEGLEKARELESAVTITALMAPGEYAAHAENGGKTVVSGIFRNKDAKQMKHDLELARKYISIKVGSPVAAGLPHPVA